MLQDCSKSNSQNALTCGYVLPRHTWPKSWMNIEDPVVPLERNLYGHPLAGLLWDRQYEEVLLGLGWKKVRNLECLFVHRRQGLFLSEHVDDIKMAGTKQSMAPVWKKVMKNVDLDEPTSFLDHVYLRCTQRDCASNDSLVKQCKEMCLLEVQNNFLDGKNLMQKPLHGPTIWKDMLKSAWK